MFEFKNHAFECGVERKRRVAQVMDDFVDKLLDLFLGGLLHLDLLLGARFGGADH